MRRAIQRLVQDPLALKLLNGEFPEGETIEVDAQPGATSCSSRSWTSRAGRAVRPISHGWTRIRPLAYAAHARPSVANNRESITSVNTLKTALLLGPAQRRPDGRRRALGGRNGIYIGLTMAAVMNFGSYFFSDKIALCRIRRSRSRETENPEVYRRVAAHRAQPLPAHGSAHAQAVDHPRGFAQRFRHRPQPAARLGGVHRRHSATDERSRDRRRGGARARPRAASRYPDQLGGGHHCRRHHLAGAAWPSGSAACAATTTMAAAVRRALP